MTRVTSRQRLILHLVALHIGCFVLVWIALRDRPAWLLGSEALLVCSLGIGFAWVRALTEPSERMAEWSRLLEDHDFTVRFREMGPSEVRPLLRVYNRMVDQLRSERVHNQEQEDLYRRVLDVSPTGVVMFDLEGRIERANPAAVRLLTTSRLDQRSADPEVRGAPVAPNSAALIRGLHCHEIPSPLAEAMEQLEPGDVRVLTMRGPLRVRVRRGSYFDRGFSRGYVLIEEFTEEYLRAERSAYEKLVRMMSHEVNNTTSAVSSLLGSCLQYREQIAPTDQGDYVRALEVAISRNGQMNRFMRGFADVVRLPSPDKEPTDIWSLLQRVIDLFREEARRRRIELREELPITTVPQALTTVPQALTTVSRATTTVPPGPPALIVLCDPAQVEQALINIVKNAMEAIGEDGVVTIRGGLAPSGSSILADMQDAPAPKWIEIEDTGPGLPKEVQDQLFTSFFSTKENGRGIGLTLVREILLAHNCGFSLEAPAPRSTRFRITFPK